MDEEDINLNDVQNTSYFKILIYKKIKNAMEKGKDIYYIPNLDNPELKIERMLKMRDILPTYNFNLLFFHNEFKSDQISTTVMEHLSEFNCSQVIKDY